MIQEHRCCHIIDVFDRQIVCHLESLRARAGESLEALENAVVARFPGGPRGRRPILQSDNGCQPTTRSFLETLKVLDINAQFIDVSEPRQNAFIERYFRSLKEEEVWPNIYETVEDVKAGIADYVRFYNHNREHSALGYLPPAEFARLAAQRPSQDVA